MRKLMIRVHRWCGLAMAAFLVIAGLTGTLLAFSEEIDRALNPGLRVVLPQGRPLSNEALIGIAERRYPQATISSMSLRRAPDESASIRMAAAPPATAGAAAELTFDELILNPYTGAVIRERRSDEPGFSRAAFVEDVLSLHYALLMPDPWGLVLMGVVAIVWLINCFIGFYLTLPQRRGRFLTAWTPAWKVRSVRPFWRFSFDFHRAAGLWLWGVFFVFALSSVQFNLFEPVFRPVFSMFLPVVVPGEEIPVKAHASTRPALGWQEALARGRTLMAEVAAREGFAPGPETFMSFDRSRDTITYAIDSSLDVWDEGGTTEVVFSATDGRALAFSHPHIASGNTLLYWLAALHMGKVWGVSYRVFIALMGLAVAAVSITGVVVWLRRRPVAK